MAKSVTSTRSHSSKVSHASVQSKHTQKSSRSTKSQRSSKSRSSEASSLADQLSRIDGKSTGTKGSTAAGDGSIKSHKSSSSKRSSSSRRSSASKKSTTKGSSKKSEVRELEKIEEKAPMISPEQPDMNLDVNTTTSSWREPYQSSSSSVSSWSDSVSTKSTMMSNASGPVSHFRLLSICFLERYLESYLIGCINNSSLKFLFLLKRKKIKIHHPYHPKAASQHEVSRPRVLITSKVGIIVRRYYSSHRQCHHIIDMRGG